MTHFQYRAVAADGRVFTGTMRALNEAELEARLARLNLHAVRVRQSTPQRLFGAQRRIGGRDRLDFYIQLQTLLKAGVPLVDALADIRDGAAPASALQHAVGGALARIESGATLAQALVEHPGLCDRLIDGLLRAGEASGSLNAVLDRIVQMLKWRDELSARLRKALSYPAFTAAVVAGAVTFLMIYLVPQLVQFLRTMGQELPWQTRALIAVSDAFVHYWYLILGAPPVAALLGAAIVRRNPALRHRFDWTLLRLPLIGPLLKRVELARFAATLALMYKAGVPLLEGLRQAQDAMTNRILADAVGRVRAMLGNGAGLAEAMEAVGLMPPLLLRMVRVGERSGDLDGALEHVNYFFTRDVDEQIARMQSKLEPALTVILGLLLAWVLAAVLGPVYEAVGSIRS